MASPIPQRTVEQQSLEHEQLKSLINSMADGVIACDDRGTVVLYNGAALNILDANATLQGLSIDKVVPLFDPNKEKVNAKQLVLSTKTSLASRDYLLGYSDGSFANLYMSIAPVRLGYGQKGASGFVLLLRDITHEKSLEEERNEFISVVSHELRTPIAIAEGNIGNAEFIVENTNNKKAVLDALKQAHDQTIYLADMINDLSTLSRAERGVLKVEPENINAHDLVQDLLKNYTPDAEKKGLKLSAELDPNLTMLFSSRLYVREILQNFITNAIKYTDEGSVTIYAKHVVNGVEFAVTDSGIGISKADQEKVFDKFFRSEDYRTRQHNGTGLGLYVAQKLMKLLGAEIRLDSELNKGSTFTITIPNIEVEKPKKGQAS
jgi:PAS domain S-box-containing protein